MRTKMYYNKNEVTKYEGKSGPRSFTSVGIVPVIGAGEVKKGYGTKWDPYLLPIGYGHTIIQRSVLECIWAGAKSVWVVCNPDTKPLLKYQLGHWTTDPAVMEKGHEKVMNNQPRIPIYYVPMDLDCVKKWDTVAWAILVGARTAYETWGRVSRFHIPENFYVSFPYAAYSPRFFYAYPLRGQMYKKKRNIYLATPEGKSVLDGEHVGFSFQGAKIFDYMKRVEYIERKECFDLRCKNKITGNDDVDALRELLSLKNIFGHESMLDENDIVAKLPWYYDMTKWQGYCDFLGSKHQKQSKHWWRYRMFHPRSQTYGVFEWLRENEYF